MAIERIKVKLIPTKAQYLNKGIIIFYKAYPSIFLCYLVKFIFLLCILRLVFETKWKWTKQNRTERNKIEQTFNRTEQVLKIIRTIVEQNKKKQNKTEQMFERIENRTKLSRTNNKNDQNESSVQNKSTLTEPNDTKQIFNRTKNKTKQNKY